MNYFQQFLAGKNQQHIIANAFNVLANKGFLRDQGILTLEIVQEFYRLIRSKPRNAKMIKEKLLSYCSRTPIQTDIIWQHRPVMTLMKRCKTIDKANGKEIFSPFFHAVALKSYVRNGNLLTLTTNDSLSGTDGETTIKCTVCINDRGDEVLKTCNEVEKWCLGHEKCYYFVLQ